VQIVLREFGGLGNQLFQYAAGRYYAKRYAADLRIAADPDWSAQCNGYPRPCLLQHFRIAAGLEKRSLLDRTVLTQKPWLKAASVPLKRALRIGVFAEQPEQQYTFLRDLPFERNLDTLYLQGYFQTHALVEAVAAELREDLQFREPTLGSGREFFDQIVHARNAVSLHIRRGDSVLPWEGKVVLPPAYYGQAISIIRERLVDPVFFVFSDDIALAKAALPQDVRLIFVGHNDEFSAHEDLRLMSLCGHHILANSTFSWWGAWLNPRKEKTVIAPSRWFVTSEDRHRNLLAPNWILLDTVGAEALV